MYYRLFTLLGIFLTLQLSTIFASPIQQNSDQYLEGYLHSILEHNYGISAAAIEVKDRTVIINDQDVETVKQGQIVNKINQVVQYVGGADRIIWRSKPSKNLFIKTQDTDDLGKDGFKNISMPNNTLFMPLIADPRWPRFTLAYQHFSKDKYSKHVFAPNFGASFALYRLANSDLTHQWEIGVQAGLFAIMDVGRKPTALINADYYVAMPISYKHNNFSALIRGYHMSSHLGDEFMLTKEGKKIKRINLSIEGIDLIGSYEFNNFRFYLGGGYIVHKDPKYIKPGKVQGGIEYLANRTFLNGRFRPVAAMDLKAEELNNWYLGRSIKVGVQLENSILISSKTQLLIEYFSGKSMHGQFYNNSIEYVGIGLQAFL